MNLEPNWKLNASVLIGAAALIFSVLYFVSDLVELIQGGFSPPQLAMTYAAEAPLPLFVLGLYAVQWPHLGTLGLIGSLTYAYTFVFFTGTVLYAIINHTTNWDALATQLGSWVTVHSVLMILAGATLGVAVIRARVLPRWTGVTLIAGMILMAATIGMPDVVQTASAGVRDLAFAGMGASLLRPRRHVPCPHGRDDERFTMTPPRPAPTRSQASCSAT